MARYVLQKMGIGFPIIQLLSPTMKTLHVDASVALLSVVLSWRTHETLVWPEGTQGAQVKEVIKC